MTKSKAKPVNQKSRIDRLFAKPVVQIRYLIGAIVTLLGSTTYWSVLGAKLNQSNADQLVNVHLFEKLSTFHAASWPSQHMFLIKWPLFWLVKLFGSTNTSYILATVLLNLVTVGVFGFVLYRIERRPLYIGTILLALASVLMVVPAQPYAGALLPVNMAMLATRNIEYGVYIVGLALLIRSTSLLSKKSVLAVTVLAALFASDRLFLMICLLGAFLAAASYFRGRLKSTKEPSRLATQWLALSGLAGVVSLLTIWFIAALKITHIASAGKVGPYGIVTSLHRIALACLHAVLGIVTNFGANPAQDVTLIRSIPANILHGLTHPAGLTYVVNGLVLVGALLCVLRIFRTSFHILKVKQHPDYSASLALLLVWSSLASVLLFVFSSHEYAVDARYLAITLFAGFSAIAVVVRNYKFQVKNIVLVGLLLFTSTLLGSTAAARQYHQGVAAANVIRQRDEKVTKVLQNRHVDTLVGDYWRVFPIHQLGHSKQTVSPLVDCVTPRDVLSSTRWKIDLHTHSFAYLISFDDSQTDFPACTIDQVTSAFGEPNDTQLIDGTAVQPKEMMLFYDKGIQPKRPPSAGGPTYRLPVENNPVLPAKLSELAKSPCPTKTILTVVAHEDDDLLFMNPDLHNSIKAGDCMRTVFVTSGDAGHDEFYWLGRERGSQSAYLNMLGSNSIWNKRVLDFGSGKYATVATPILNSKVSLITLHLPDGNLEGQGFRETGSQSLAKLETDKISSIHTIDGQSVYTLDELAGVVVKLIETYKPAEIRTQARYPSAKYPDHSDHVAAGRLVKIAKTAYLKQDTARSDIPVSYYIGYPVHGMEPNVTGSDLKEKMDAFLSYANYDAAVCHSVEECHKTATYGTYLQRQYQHNQ